MVTEVAGYLLRERVVTAPGGNVWRAEPVGAPGRIVLVEVIPVTAPHGAVQRLRREGEILADLAHPGLVHRLDVVATRDAVALVTPWTSGGSLATLLTQHQEGLDPVVVADLGVRLASAVAALHGAGLVHGNIRPANVLLDRDHRPLLSDVAVAWLRPDTTTPTDRGGCADPHMAEGPDPDVHRDLYDLGITLHQALTGAPPGTGADVPTTANTGSRTTTEQRPWRATAADIRGTRELHAAIASTFDRDPGRRPGGAQEFAARLAAIDLEHDRPRAYPAAHPTTRSGPQPEGTVGSAGVLGAVAPDPRTVPTVRRRRVPRALLAATAAAILLVPLGIVGAALTTGGESTPASVAGSATGATTPRQPAPVCAGATEPTNDRELLLADVHGRGCSDLVAWDGRTLELLLPETQPTPDGAATHGRSYDLDAEPDDVLLFGDWTCDGRDAPALYRPRDGQLFTFDALADAGAEVAARGTPTDVIGGLPRVRTDATGCDHVEVAPA